MAFGLTGQGFQFVQFKRFIPFKNRLSAFARQVWQTSCEKEKAEEHVGTSVQLGVHDVPSSDFAVYNSSFAYLLCLSIPNVQHFLTDLKVMAEGMCNVSCKC